MLFQGQEFAASSPFLYFADHKPELAELVREGRSQFLRQFRSLASEEMQALLRIPDIPRTFESSKLDFSQRQRHRAVYQLHRDLLRLRREDDVISGRGREGLDGAVLGNGAFILRYFARTAADRLIAVNFGTDLHLDPAPEPLLAPPAGHHWETILSTENPIYGGHGIAPLDTEENWRIPGNATTVLAALPGAAD